MTSAGSRRHTAEVLVIGGGLVGLCSALAVAERGRAVTLVTRRLPGEASPAAAGVLAPRIDRHPGAALEFSLAARDDYPSYLERLARMTGEDVPVTARGALDIPGDAELFPGPGGRRLDPAELRELEPAVRAEGGATFFADDLAIDNARLVDVLRRQLETMRDVRIVDALVDDVALDAGSIAVRTAAGDAIHCERLIVAAGAWVSWIRGLDLAIPVEPVRGQMLALGATFVRHVIIGADCYLTPRGRETLVGSTMERVGLVPGTTEEALTALHVAATALCPALGAAPRTRAWSGLRPVTPDLLPIIDRHPADARVILACGHSRNGILLGPATGDVAARLALGEEPGKDLSPFTVGRFV